MKISFCKSLKKATIRVFNFEGLKFVVSRSIKNLLVNVFEDLLKILSLVQAAMMLHIIITFWWIVNNHEIKTI